jgi:hypothetical protein
MNSWAVEEDGQPTEDQRAIEAAPDRGERA